MFEFYQIRHTGQSEVELLVPDIDREYVLSAFMLHPEDGLAVIDQPLLVNKQNVYKHRTCNYQ